MEILKRLQELFLKIFNIARERFFLVAKKGASTSRPSPLSSPGEGWEEVEAPLYDELIQKRNTLQTMNKPPGYEIGFDEDGSIPPSLNTQHISLCDALDRLLNTGVVACGDITISVANIDLIYIGLNAVLSSVDTLREMQKE